MKSLKQIMLPGLLKLLHEYEKALTNELTPMQKELLLLNINRLKEILKSLTE